MTTNILKSSLNGKRFEDLTSAESMLLDLGFTRYKKGLYKAYPDRLVYYFNQGALNAFVQEKYQIDLKRVPDAACIIEPMDTSEPIQLKILEKKFQQVLGTADQKLYGAPLFRREYELIFGPRFKIDYAFCMSNYFKEKMSPTGHLKYLPVLLEEHNIRYLYGSDDNYFQQLKEWLGLTEQLVSVKYPNKLLPKQYTRPFLKWVGGKTQLLDTLIQQFPTNMTNYIEPFLGGGSVLFGLLTAKLSGAIQVTGKIIASDLNEPLVYAYKNLQIDVENVITTLTKLTETFKSLTDEKEQEAHYYTLRSTYNAFSVEEKQSARGTAHFILLNKTCWRGVFRMGPNGFNVPYGHYKKPEVFKPEHLREIHKLIQDVQFEVCGFEVMLSKANQGDFVYLDPPYVPVDSKGFVQYTKDGFNKESHEKLFTEVHNLQKKEVQFILSNADVPLVRETFKDPKKYVIHALTCKRTIHSKNPGATAGEVLVKMIS